MREHPGLSQQNVANLAGVSRSQYGRMKRGDIRIAQTPYDFMLVADALARRPSRSRQRRLTERLQSAPSRA
jgi:predicted transcriptional regulator